MEQAALVLTALLTLGCGGRASESDSGEPPKGGGGQVPAGGGSGQVPQDYVPDSIAPFDDLHLDDGSFENGQGFGWDTCFTKTPGSLKMGELGASNGNYFLEFASSPCDGICSPENSADSQLYAWFGEGKQPTEPFGLYLDLINLDGASPDGRFVLYAVDLSCNTLRPLFDVPLSDFSLTRTWSTRCVEPALEPGERLGLAVTGPRYHIGLDALRSGPTCH